MSVSNPGKNIGMEGLDRQIVITRHINPLNKGVVKTDRKTTTTWKTEIMKVEEHRRTNTPPGLLSIKVLKALGTTEKDYISAHDRRYGMENIHHHPKVPTPIFL